MDMDNKKLLDEERAENNLEEIFKECDKLKEAIFKIRKQIKNKKFYVINKKEGKK